MSSSVYWLQLEAQNFDASIFDTQDLSTIRGGSLLLRDLVRRANDWLVDRYAETVTCATLGGSIGIWRLEASDKDARELASALGKALKQGIYRNVAFGIGIIPDSGGGYRVQRSRLAAVLQRQRLAQARTPYPESPDSAGVCQLDLVRPRGSHRQKTGPNTHIEISDSVFERRRHGIKKKQELIKEQIGTRSEFLSAESQVLLAASNRPFAMQINSISEGADPPAGLKSALMDKICIISLDGNGFGDIQNAILGEDEGGGVEGQRQFDLELARLRALLIERVYDKLVGLGGVGRPSEEEVFVRKDLEERVPDKIVRFEMLLWGGDELMFIVPARTAWELLCELAQNIQSAHLCGQPVSFAIGAVFCHHDSPISRVKMLADNLVRHVKGLKSLDGFGRNGKNETLLLPQVLESFDHIGANVNGFLSSRWPKKTDSECVPSARGSAFDVLDLEEMAVLRLAAQDLANGRGGKFSRGRLRKTAHALHLGVAPGAGYRDEDKWFQYVADSAGLLSGDNCKAALERIGRDRLFVLLEHFWDYIVPIRSTVSNSSREGDVK